jgi:hypothetical protein
MSNTKIILNILSFGLLIWLLFESLGQINIAATKNRSLVNTDKIRIDSIPNIETVKSESKKLLDQRYQDFEAESDRSIIRSRVILFVILLQIVGLFKIALPK